jgi:hypothetical protein
MFRWESKIEQCYQSPRGYFCRVRSIIFGHVSAGDSRALYMPHRIHHLVSGENEQYAPAHMNFPLDQS